MSTRAALCLLVAVAACGKKNAATKDDAGSGNPPKDAKAIDASVTADAPPIAACTPVDGTTVTVRHIGKVSGSAVLATAPLNDGRLFVIEQLGRIRIFDKEQLQTDPFLDLEDSDGACNVAGIAENDCASNLKCVAVRNSAGVYQRCGDLVVAGGEQGLLGLAFHPQYATNRQFFVYFTSTNPRSDLPGGEAFVDTLVRYTGLANDPTKADPASATTILSIPDFAVNHNGGMVEFGSDGFLYLAIGDGGGGGDPRRNAQTTNPSKCLKPNCQPLLGKMMRLDVDHPAGGKPYGIPLDNPFAASTTGDLPEIWMYGLRNPWRWSFDRLTGDLWIGDVGQGQIEELDVIPAGQQAGKNLGWSAYEGHVCCVDQSDKCTQSPPDQACDTTGKTFPQVEKTHGGDGWNAIIGGQVYRGKCYPGIVGTYFFDDNGHRVLESAVLNNDGTVTAHDVPVPAGMTAWPASPASLHADAAGELFLTTTAGDVFHIEAGP